MNNSTTTSTITTAVNPTTAIATVTCTTSKAEVVILGFCCFLLSQPIFHVENR